VLAAEAATRGLAVEQVRADYISGTSLRRFARPDEIAGLCPFLASDAARFISGQAIAVDGDTETYRTR
jgi:NAD(P)-dependent dehydrogenase (short-subunit alcohol dehydrogenase family)